MKEIFKRITFCTLAVVSLLTSALAFFPATVLAAGETYRWIDFNTIEVSGGSLTNTGTLKLSQGSNPESFSFQKQPKHKDGCSLSLTVTLTGANTARLSTPKPKDQDSIGNPGENYCDDPKYELKCSGWGPWKECTKTFVGAQFPGIYEDYNGKTVNIGGTRPGSSNQTETDLDKGVGVTINAPNPANASPANITVQIKKQDGTAPFTANPAQEAALGSADPNGQNYLEPDYLPVYYHSNFLLDPGKYLVCADIVIADCRQFEKKKFEPLSLEYGETSTERSVIAKITVDYIGGVQDMTVGPLEVTLRKPDGSIIAVQTNKQTHKMSSDEEQANGLVMVEYTFGLEGVFRDMDPATYQVCVTGLSECKDVVKQSGNNAIVEFRIDWNDFSEDQEYDRDCKEKYEIMGTRAITFAVCAVIDTGTFVIGQLDTVISDLLTVDVQNVFNDDDASNAFHQAWNSFRLFALGLIVVAALIMVVSQASGLEIIDAYTVKKVLPRLLFAAIFITLSWDILEFLTTLSNDAGTGIRSLIYAPFKDMANIGGNIAGGSIVVLTLISTGAALAFGFFGLLSFVVTGLLASLVAFAVLIFRKMLIILLIMMAPFAIASYVLPNTSKLWNIWKDALMAALIVFPIIMAFIAIGRVTAVVSFNAPGSPIVNQLIAIIAYFAPYFMISMAFRMAGGVIAKVSGLANDASKGGFDRLKKYRANISKENMQKMAAGRRFQGNNALAKGFNATTFGAATFAKSRNKSSILTAQGRQAMFEQQRSLNAMRYGQTDQAKVGIDNDLMLQAQTYVNQAEAEENIAVDFGMMSRNESGTGNYDRDENGNYHRVADGTGDYDVDNDTVKIAIGAARANGGWGRDQQLHAARALFNTGTGYGTLKQVHQTVQRVVGKNEELAKAVLGYGNAKAGPTHRLDLKQGFTEQMRLYREMRDTGDLSPERLDRAVMEAVKGVDAVSMAIGGRPMVMENVMPALTRTIERQKIIANTPGVVYHENGAIVDDQGRTAQQAAQEEIGRLSGIVKQYEQNVARYASPMTVQQIDEYALRPTATTVATSAGAAPREIYVRDPATNLPIINPTINQPVTTTNPNYDPSIARGYNQQAPGQNRRNR